jgi:hypothetical protein
MANPHGPLGTGPHPGTTLDPPQPPQPPPIDPDELRQLELLNEAVLNSFIATPNPMPPFGKAKLSWDITMPTTILIGVHPEVHITDGVGDAVVDPKGQRNIAPYAEQDWSVYLKTPKASRFLGSVSVTVDVSTCTTVDTAAGVIIALIKGQAEAPFPAGGQISIRGGGAKVDIGINSFVVDVPLTASVPNWFDADVDVSMGFTLSADDGTLRGSCDFATTKVSPGFLSTVLSVGCAAAVADGVEAASDGFLNNFVGGVITQRMVDNVQANINDNLARLNANSTSGSYRFYNLSLTQDGMTYRFCPAHPGTGGGTGPTHHPPIGGGDVHPITG